jgi:hypothetical protein
VLFSRKTRTNKGVFDAVFVRQITVFGNLVISLLALLGRKRVGFWFVAADGRAFAEEEIRSYRGVRGDSVAL